MAVVPTGGVGADGLPPLVSGGVQDSGNSPSTPVLNISALLALSSPMMSPALTGMLVVNWSGPNWLPLVDTVALEATAEYLPPPAGRSTRSVTLLLALSDAIRHATIVPSTGAAYIESATEPDHWMNVQLPQVGWFCSESVTSVEGPITIVPGG